MYRDTYVLSPGFAKRIRVDNISSLGQVDELEKLRGRVSRNVHVGPEVFYQSPSKIEPSRPAIVSFEDMRNAPPWRSTIARLPRRAIRVQVIHIVVEQANVQFGMHVASPSLA
ncbi:hypothetical protein PM082_017273 [Marasmius tenuissimus]|nr:hypothetical protein PM082_017273 [Marasmius tenuissimus]